MPHFPLLGGFIRADWPITLRFRGVALVKGLGGRCWGRANTGWSDRGCLKIGILRPRENLLAIGIIITGGWASGPRGWYVS